MTMTAGPLAGQDDEPRAGHRTFLPSYDDDAPPPQPRSSLGRMTPDELFVRVGSWGAALGLAWLTTQRLLPLPGIPYFLVAWFLLGLLVTAIATTMTGTAVEVTDRLAAAVVTGAALLVGAALLSTVVYVAAKGWRPVTHLNFFTSDMAGVGPRDAFTTGGIKHAIVGSLIEIGIAVAITLPLGIGTAVFMTEVGGRFARIVRTVVEAMTALPSIVAGLFVYSVWILALGQPKSGLAASLAISVMMLPIIARASDVVLRVVPGGLREASLALGASRWRTVWHVVLPTARPGLATALILGVARGIGETSPVLLTSGAAGFLVTNPSTGAMNSLPLFIYTNVRSGDPTAIQRAYGAAFVLLALVLVLFVVARLLARDPDHHSLHPPTLGPSRQPEGLMNTRLTPLLVTLLGGLALALAILGTGAGTASADATSGRADAAAARAAYATIEGTGSTWSELILQQWIADVNRNGIQVVYTGGGSTKGRKDFSQNSTDFAISEIPYQGTDESGQADTSNGRALRLPADRGRRHGVHLPAQGRRPAGPQPAAVGRDHRQDLHRQDHELERPADRRGQQRPCVPGQDDHPGRALRRIRHDRPVHHLDGQDLPGHLAALLRPVRAHVVLPAAQRGEHAGPGRLGPGDEHCLGLRRRRHHRLRRVLLPGQQGLPGRQGPQQGRLLRRADAVRDRRGADQGEDQPGQDGPDEVPHPDPGRRLRQPRPAGLPDLVVLLHDHPDGGDRPPDDDGEAAEPGRLPLLLAVRRADQGRPLRLLATAAQPRPGRVQPDRQAQEAPTPRST